MFNDYWMLDQGFIEREKRGDLGDLVSRRHSDKATVTADPEDTMLAAYARMKLYDISQIPVLESGKIIGILDESDILLKVYGHEEKFRDKVRAAMTTKLDIVGAKAPLSDLLPIFARDHVAIVQEGDQFLGLITRIDLLNHLRRRMK
jgi:cystathionine beta-synthase